MSKPSCVDGETRKANDGDDDGSDEEEERATYLYHVNSVDLLKKHMLQDTGGVQGGAEGGQRALDALEKEDEGDDARSRRRHRATPHAITHARGAFG